LGTLRQIRSLGEREWVDVAIAGSNYQIQTMLENNGLLLTTNVEWDNFPNGVTSIGGHAFIYCSSLTSIAIPNSVTSIGDHAFNNCRSLPSITIPDGVTSIGNYAFDNCNSLVSVIIENGWVAPSLNISYSAYLSVSSMVDMFTKLGTTGTAATITLGATNLAKLTSDKKAIATGKGYTLV
jgi:hypothetical protein